MKRDMFKNWVNGADGWRALIPGALPEAGVEASFSDIASAHGLDWAATRARMREEGRYHVETY